MRVLIFTGCLTATALLWLQQLTGFAPVTETRGLFRNNQATVGQATVGAAFSEDGAANSLTRTETSPTEMSASAKEDRDGGMKVAMVSPSITAQGTSLTPKLPAGNAPDSSDAAALQHLRERLEDCLTACETFPGYSARLEQQIFLNGELRETEYIDLKIRHAPFSVFMHWHRDGQEVLYVDGQHQGRLLAHPTRGLGSLRKVWKLRPDSAQAMKNSRHPVTKLGIENLTDEVFKFHQSRGFSANGLTITEKNCHLGSIPCVRFEIRFESPTEGKDFSHTRLMFDPETRLLLALENEGWSHQGQRSGLLERYVYHDIRIGEVNEGDFDHNNPKYNLAQK